MSDAETRSPPQRVQPLSQKAEVSLMTGTRDTSVSSTSAVSIPMVAVSFMMRSYCTHARRFASPKRAIVRGEDRASPIRDKLRSDPVILH